MTPRPVNKRAPRPRAAAHITSILENGAQPPERISASDIPRGFHFGATACGVKKKWGTLDLALVSADSPAACAAVFTTNRMKAAPVLLSAEHLRRSGGRMRALAVNSGNANCSTGAHGMHVSRTTARGVASALGCAPEQVFVCSTGVIGVPLPVEKITGALPALSKMLGTSPRHFALMSRAIMTTDTRPKWAAAGVRIGGRTVRIAGCAKGAGMIHPQMATMLAFVFTDAAIAPGLLRRAVREAAGRTFNCITVDGDTSTNDTLAVFASGASGVSVASHSSLATNHSRSYRQLCAALEHVCKQLALAIVADGEGAQRVVEIEVRGARSAQDADRAARTIANSPLVKTALAGADPNWGRILAAAGRSGARFHPDEATVWMAGIKVYARGRALPFDERAAHRKLLSPFAKLAVDLGAQAAKRSTKKALSRHSSRVTRHLARMWTCDFTEDYVHINADYRT